MNNVDSLIKELKRFSSRIITFGDPIYDNRVPEFEMRHSLFLPKDYKYIINQTNGFSLIGNTVLGIYKISTIDSLESTYIREHNLVKVPMYKHIVPFSPDGQGNYYCFNTLEHTNGGTSCEIIFWLSNYQYTDEDKPEVVYDTFVDFVNEVFIDWTLEDYDYHGNRKK